MDPDLADSNFSFSNLPGEINAPKGAPLFFQSEDSRSAKVDKVALGVFQHYPQPLHPFNNVVAHKFNQVGDPSFEDSSFGASQYTYVDVSNGGQQLGVAEDFLVADENTDPGSLEEADSVQNEPIHLPSLAAFRDLAQEIPNKDVIDRVYAFLKENGSKLVQKAIRKGSMFEILFESKVKIFASSKGKLFIELKTLGTGAYKTASKIVKVAPFALEQVKRNFEAVKVIVIERELLPEQRLKMGVTLEEIENEKQINQTLLKSYKTGAARLTRVALYKTVVVTMGTEKRTGFMGPFASGGDLDQWILKGKHTQFADKVKIALDMAVAISELHAQGIVHRDIKPDNFLVFEDENGTLKCVKICDFGKASFVDAKKATKNVKYFQMAYTPPEWRLPERDLKGPPADIFQLGIALYQIFAEKRTIELHFNFKILDEISKKTLGEQNALLKKLDPSLISKIQNFFEGGLKREAVSAKLHETVDEWPGMDQIDDRVRFMISEMVSSQPDRRPPIEKVVDFFKKLMP